MSLITANHAREQHVSETTRITHEVHKYITALGSQILDRTQSGHYDLRFGVTGDNKVHAEFRRQVREAGYSITEVDADDEEVRRVYLISWHPDTTISGLNLEDFEIRDDD